MMMNRQTFARTNTQTIVQRVTLLRELVPHAKSIAEICCGDCTRQHKAYTQQLGVRTYRGLDINPIIVDANRKVGIECYCGDALDRNALSRFTPDDAIFFGPPLSMDCDGHRLLLFDAVQPSYADFAKLLLNELRYSGLLVCICPKSTTMGDVAKLHHEIRACRTDFNLWLIHHSYSTITGGDEQTDRRLKYIELWFSDQLDNLWEVRSQALLVK
jgi:hypothetical protein